MNTEQTLEQKREKAAEYLRSHNIHRADVNCAHRYERGSDNPPPPRFDCSPDGNAPRKELEGMK